MNNCFLDYLKEQDVEIVYDFPLKQLSAIGIGANASVLLRPKTEVAFINILSTVYSKAVNCRIVGRMSNILPPDEDFDGVVLCTSKLNGYSVAENILNVQCGASLSKIIKRLSEKNLGGFEALYGIPGSVGGMLVSNAGAFGTQISECVIDARLYDFKKGVITLSNKELCFAYRDSIIQKEGLIVLSARLSLTATDKNTSLEKIRAFTEKRRATQPYGKKSLGSIFKRYGDVPIARLIDSLGLKGYRIGGAEISKKHAGFIIAHEGAKAEDVSALIQFIKTKIYSEYGIVPEEEIKYF